MRVLEKDGVKILNTDGKLLSLEGDMTISSLKGFFEESPVEVVETVHGDMMLIYKDGKAKKMVVNFHASNIYKNGFGRYGEILDVIAGIAVLIPRDIYTQLENAPNF